MPSELVFSVAAKTATPATPISLSDAGLKEREDLQEWVIAHPQMLGDGVKIVSFEFGKWTGVGGALEKDRLDVLGLDTDGHLVVVELKRDKAPNTVDMQALKYVALVSRFTRDDLDKLYAQYRNTYKKESLSVEEAAAELDEWATITEESLRLPRMIVMASEFPRTVTATLVFLHQQLGLDVRLVAFQAYKSGTDTLLTVSQHYPPPDVEEFVLSPEVNEAKQQRSARQSRKREATIVSLLLAGDVLEPGAPLAFHCPVVGAQAEVDTWISENPARGRAEWQEDTSTPLIWEADGQAYSLTALASLILEQAAGRTPEIKGPICWVDDQGVSLAERAEVVTSGSEIPPEIHLAKLTDELRPVFDGLDKGIRAFGDDVTRQSRVKSFKYYRDKKMVDLLVHTKHLSLYVRHLKNAPPDPAGLIVRDATPKYVHLRISSMNDVSAALAIVQAAYDQS